MGRERCSPDPKPPPSRGPVPVPPACGPGTRDAGPSAPAGPGSRGFHPGQECRLHSDFLVSLTQELSSNPLPFVWKIEPCHAC